MSLTIATRAGNLSKSCAFPITIWTRRSSTMNVTFLSRLIRFSLRLSAPLTECHYIISCVFLHEVELRRLGERAKRVRQGQRSLGALCRLHGITQTRLRVLRLHLAVHLHDLIVPRLERRRQLASSLASLLASLARHTALCHF